MKDYKLCDLEDLTNIQLEKLIKKIQDKMKEIRQLSFDNCDSPSKQDKNVKLANKIKHYRGQLIKIYYFYKWKLDNKKFTHACVDRYFSTEELERVRLKYDRLKKLERIIGD